MAATYKDTYPYEPFTPSGETTPITSKLKDSFPLTDAIDWFWRNFVSEDGSGFRDALIKPLVGDYDKISQNGEAWRHVENQLSNFNANITDNTHVLLDGSWSGKAADSYGELIEQVWSPALLLAETTAQFIAIGFEKFTAAVISIAKKACEVLDAIVKAIAKLAKKASPWGAAVGVIEWILSGFEDFPYWDEVNVIRGAIEKIDTLHSQIREMVALFTKYLGAGEGFLNAAQRIPEIDSGSDLFYIGKKVATGTNAIKKANREGKELREQHKAEREKVLKKANSGR